MARYTRMPCKHVEDSYGEREIFEEVMVTWWKCDIKIATKRRTSHLLLTNESENIEKYMLQMNSTVALPGMHPGRTTIEEDCDVPRDKIHATAFQLLGTTTRKTITGLVWWKWWWRNRGHASRGKAHKDNCLAMFFLHIVFPKIPDPEDLAPCYRRGPPKTI